MDDQTVPTRTRSLTLNSEGIARVQAAMEAKWRSEKRREKLTWERKAMLLGIAQATAKRLLQGEKVDRSTIAIVFTQLGLQWDESLVVRPSPARDMVAPVAEASEAPLVRPNRRPAITWLAVATVLALAFVLLAPRPADAPSPAPDWKTRFQSLLDSGTADFHAARYPEAKAKIDEAIALVRLKEGGAGAFASVLRVSGDIAMATGDLDTARTRYQECLTIRQATDQPQCHPPLQEALGEVELKAGDTAAVWEYYHAAMLGYREHRVPSGEAFAMHGLGLVKLRTNAPREALGWFAQAEALLRPDPGAADALASLRSDQAFALAATGKADQAREMLEACLDPWRRKDHPRWVANTYLKLAKVAQSTGDLRAVQDFGQACSRYYDEAGDRLGQQECGRLLLAARQDRLSRAN